MCHRILTAIVHCLTTMQHGCTSNKAHQTDDYFHGRVIVPHVLCSDVQLDVKMDYGGS